MKKLLVFAVFFVLLVLGGCSYSQYLLTVEYANPNTGGTEQLDIPVSQYVYDGTGVGTDYDVTVRTVVLGIRIPVTRNSESGMALLDTFPVTMAFGCILAPLFIGRRKVVNFLMGAIVGVGVFIFLSSTTASDFIAVGVVVDKTFQIISGY